MSGIMVTERPLGSLWYSKHAEKGQKILINLSQSRTLQPFCPFLSCKKEIADLAVDRSSVSECGFFDYQLIWQSHFWHLFWPGMDDGLNHKKLDSFTVTFLTHLICVWRYKVYLTLNMDVFCWLWGRVRTTGSLGHSTNSSGRVCSIDTYIYPC